MKTKTAWFGVGLWVVAGIAWGAEGLWLGEDDRVAVVAKSAGTEWAEAASVLLECSELEIPLAVFHGTLTEEERTAETEALPPENGAIEETGAGFGALAEKLADFDPSHVVLTGWKFGEGVPPGVAEALEETPAMILQAVASKGDYTMSLADFQREVRNVLLPTFGLAASRKGVDHFRRVAADDISVQEEDGDDAAGEEPPKEEWAKAGEPPAAEEAGKAEGKETGRAKLKPRTKLPDAPKAKSWFDMPVSW